MCVLWCRLYDCRDGRGLKIELNVDPNGCHATCSFEESLESIRPNDYTDSEGSSVTSTSSSDSDADEELVAKPTSRGLQRSVKMAPGETFEKRTYDVNFDYESLVERMRKCAKLEEQLSGLRALLPNSTRVSTC